MNRRPSTALTALAPLEILRVFRYSDMTALLARAPRARCRDPSPTSPSVNKTPLEAS